MGLLAALAFAEPARGSVTPVEIEGARFAGRLDVGERALELRGAGVFRYRALFRAYAAALYLPNGVASSAALGDVPKRLEIEYFWRIDGADFARAAETLLRRSLAEAEYDALRERLRDLHAVYESVEPGDRYALEYRPGSGTELSKNGRPLAVIPGSDFAAAYFSMWLGDTPIDARLRSQLLGNLPSRARE